VFDTLPGLFIGISVSLLLLIYRASRPYVATLGREPGPEGRYSDIDRHPDNAVPPHIAILRIESGLYFANADAVRAQITRAAGADAIIAVVIDAETIPFIDVFTHGYPSVHTAVDAAGTGSVAATAPA
jgi:sulfate permease, SulP family